MLNGFKSQRARRHGILRSAVRRSAVFMAEAMEQRVLFTVDHIGLVSMPSSGTAGQTTDAFTFAMLDSNNEVDTSASGDMSLSIATGPDTDHLYGVTIQNGLASFTHVNLTVAGAYTFDASVGPDTDFLTDSVNIAAGNATKLAITGGRLFSTSAGNSFGNLEVSVEDDFGNVVTTDSSTITLSSGVEGVQMSGNFTAVAQQGVAEFDSVAITKAGTYQIVASDGELTTAVTDSLTVSPSFPSKLEVISSPMQGIAGTQLGNVTVAVEDMFGNVETSDNSTQIMVSIDGETNATLEGGNAITVTNGVATFSDLAINKTGNYTLDVTSSRSDSIDLTPSEVDGLLISSGEPARIVWGNITNQGGCITLTATIQDDFGNIVTSDNGNVTIHQSGGTGTIGGQLTVAAVDGVVTFQGLATFKSGTANFTATQGEITSGASDTFVIGAKLVFKQQLATTVAGATISNLVVLIEDGAGHVITTDNSAVTIDIASGPSGVDLGGTLTVNAVNGVATFGDISLTQTGSYVLLANDGLINSAISKAFTIKPGAVDSLEFIQQPGFGVGGTPGSAGSPLITVTAGVTITPAITVVAMDAFGNVVTNLSGVATLRADRAPDGGKLEHNLAASFSNGIATFRNAVIDIAGTYNLLASFGNVTVDSRSFAVRATTPAKLAFTEQPETTTAGIGTEVTVAVEDRFGNIVTNSAAQITITSKSGPRGVAAMSVSGSAEEGELTINSPSFTRAGNYTLVATSVGLKGATSSTFAVTASTVSQIVFSTQPSNGRVGRKESPVRVSLIDAFGNLVTTSGVAVTITTATSPIGSTLTGNTTVNTVNGVATFSNLTFSAAGNYTLVATEDVLTSAPSSLFKIVR